MTKERFCEKLRKKGVKIITYRCPMPNCTAPDVKFEEKSVFQNPYRHFRSYYEKGKPVVEQEKILSELFAQSRQQMTEHGGTIFFPLRS